MDAADKAASIAVSKAKRQSRQPPETLTAARERVLDLKWTPAEKQVVNTVFDALESREATRITVGKITKGEVLAIHGQMRLDERERKKRHVLETHPDNYWIVQDERTLRRVDEMLHDETILGADTETTGLDLYNDQIVGWSVWLPNHQVAAYVPFGHTTGQRQVSEDFAMTVARRHFDTRGVKTVWHNFKFDGHMFANHGIDVRLPWWDTKVGAKLLYEHEKSNRLKDLHAKYMLRAPDQAILFEDLFDDATIFDKDVILSGIYACGDPHKTFQLYEFQRPMIDGRDNLKTVWYQIEQPLLGVDLRLERTGFCMDLNRIRDLETRFTPVLEEAEREVRTAFGIDDAFARRMAQAMGKTADEVGEFNFQSPQHMAYLLFDVLGCDPDIGKKRFRQAPRSTSSKVLDVLLEEHEQLAPMKRYRQLAKIVSTYLRKIPEAMEPATGRLHCQFNNLGGDDDGEGGTATGRYSSSAYTKAKNSKTGNVDKGSNLQNIPARSKEGVLVRTCFVPDPGWVFVSSDLSQIEPRIIAHILHSQFGDDGMRQLYLDGRDLYTEMAMFTFSFPRENCVDKAYDPTGAFQPRKLMKEGVLAFLYGQSPAAFANRMNVSTDVAAAFFAGMRAAYPGLQPFRDWVLRMLLTRGGTPYAETLYGRKRRFPQYREEAVEVAAMEHKFYESGVQIYRSGKPDGRDDEERAEIMARRERLRSGTLTEEDIEAIRRIGMYWRHKDLKERYWKLRGRVRQAQRQAVNAIIQGSAADVLKQSMVRLDAYCVEHGYKFHASIHDEVMISVPVSSLTPQSISDIEDIMTRTVELSLPMKCDTVIQPRWMIEYSPDEWDYDAGRPTDEALEDRVSKGEPSGYEEAV